ncbi:MAG: NAD-dependent epimerase/dehydratase family protein [Gemmataceae bacterium]
MECVIGRHQRVLITGGSGFLGATLARAEVAAGRDVHLLLRSGARPDRLLELAGRYTRHDADLRDAGAVRRAVDAARPDVVYHLATNGAHPSERDRGTILATNLGGTANLLDALAGRDYKAFVHAGSSSEYGHKAAPMKPRDVLEPRSDYGVTKAAATLLCQAEALRGAPVCTVRIFSAYGPLEDATRLASSVLACCARGDAPRVTAGHQPRDWVYSDDVIELLQRAADCPAARGRILHAGGGRRQTVRDLVETAVAVSGGLVRPEYGSEPLRADEPTSWVADLTDTTALTGWAPRTTLRQGLERMWAALAPARAA